MQKQKDDIKINNVPARQGSFTLQHGRHNDLYVETPWQAKRVWISIESGRGTVSTELIASGFILTVHVESVEMVVFYCVDMGM